MSNVIQMGAARRRPGQPKDTPEDTVRRLHAVMPRKVSVLWVPGPQRTALLRYIDSLPEADRERVCDSTGDDTLYSMYLMEKGELR